MEQPSYYAILSANVRYDKNISDKAKLLFADITALSNKYGYCTASNNYFAEIFDVTKETISRNISSLEKAGHVKVELIYKGKEVIQRRIYPITQTSIPIDKNVNTPIDEKEDTLLTKKSIPIDKNMITPIDENVKENITSINTTRNNITSSNSSTTTAEDLNKMNPFEYYEEAQFGILTSVIHNDMNYYIDKFGDEGQDIVKLALEIAAYRGPEKTNWSYVKGILNNWLRTTHRTVEDIKAYEKQEATLRSNKAQSFRNNTSKEMTPEWMNKPSDEVPAHNNSNELSDDELEKEREKLRKELEESAREFEDKGGVRHHA
ncbi:DnaD domain protein [Macrococcoides caseolyticum]|uniref:DnaD domain protein n=1 Tax=Macrococcoides caseolyticum TaxID=69966 RepID=UPI0012FEDCFD